MLRCNCLRIALGLNIIKCGLNSLNVCLYIIMNILFENFTFSQITFSGIPRLNSRDSLQMVLLACLLKLCACTCMFVGNVWECHPCKML